MESVEPTRTFQLSNLLQDEKEVEEFCSYVKDHGFGKIRVTEEYENAFVEAFQIMDSFYAQNYADKCSQVFDQNKEVIPSKKI